MRKGKPSTFRVVSGICRACDRFACEFHPPTITRPVITITDPEPSTSIMKEPPSLAKSRPQLTNLRELTPDLVHDQFPSPTLRPYQKEIITKGVEAFRNGKRCLMLAAPTGFGKSYVNAAFSSATKSFYETPQLALIDQIIADQHLRGRFVEIRGKRNYRCYFQPNRE